jgi:hypothetical protein
MNQSLAKKPMRQDGWRDLSAGQRRRRKEESVYEAPPQLARRPASEEGSLVG